MARSESLYNLAQENEVFVLLHYLPKAVAAAIKDLPPRPVKGQEPHPLFDLLVALCIQHYVGFSDRRSIGMIKLLTGAVGLRIQVPSFATLNRARKDPFIKPVLDRLIEEIASPVRTLEKDVATDATGASTSSRSSWFNIRTGKRQRRSDHVMAHVTVGVLTHMPLAVDVRAKRGGDNGIFREHVARVSPRFDIEDWTADGAYPSRANCAAVAAIGATPWLKPHKNHTPRPRGVVAWKRMQLAFRDTPELAATHYNKRVQVESANSAKKRKLGDRCRAKIPAAQENEDHLKWAAYGLTVLSRAHYEWGIKLF